MSIGTRSNNHINGKKDFLTEIYCDCCGTFVCYVDDKYVFDYGLNSRRPKIKNYCDNCAVLVNKKEFEYYLNKKKGKKMSKPKEMTDVQLTSETNVDSPVVKIEKNKDPVTIEWFTVDQLITAGKCRCSILAVELGMSTENLRKELEKHYNTGEARIFFKKGRNGGVYWLPGKEPQRPAKS